MEVMAMPTNEPLTESTPQTEPLMTSNVIIAPGTDGPTVAELPAETGGPHTSEAAGPGLEGEQTVWEDHYSFKNFLGRIFLGGVLTVAWLVLAILFSEAGYRNGTLWTILLGVGVLVFWVNLAYKYLRAYRGHHYRLTTRRLFITTGFFRRRVDQLELLRIKDVYVQQSMIGDWLGIGNVVVISSEATLPKALLLGIEEPRRIMDLIWHHMRIEQSQKTSRISPV
jgi:membrane protein YdbS with pleckstrin-like domain